MTEADKRWIIDHTESGELDDGTPWIGVPNKSDRKWSTEEIFEALKWKREKSNADQNT